MTPRILHYSDVENVYDDPEKVGRLAGCIEEYRDESTLLVGTGDNTGPGVLSLVEEGAQALDFFEAVQPDAETLGNHDFDHGVERTRELIAASPQPWVSANVWLDRSGGGKSGADERFGEAEGVVPWSVAEADGSRIGFVGVTTPDTATISPEVGNLRFTDPEEAVRKHLPELRDRTDFVVVLAHMADCESLARLSGVDAVLAGHDHSKGVTRFDGTPVVRTGVNGTHVAEVLLGDDCEVNHLPITDAPVHEEVAEALADRVAESGLDDVVATVEEPIPRTEDETFCAESRLGNFVTDAYRWVSGADVAVASAGGARTGDPLAGEVRVLDLVAIAPFDNQLAVAELDGDRLRETFEQLRIFERYPDAPADYVGHVSGAQLRWEDGDLADAIVGGELLDPDQTYTLATSDHLFETDNLLSTFDAEDRVRTCGKQYDAFVEYANEKGVAPEAEGRVRLE